MEYRDYRSYIKEIGKDLLFVDDSIELGAYLSTEEWYDFMFKAQVAGYKSKNISRYRWFNKDMYRVAKVEAFLFKGLCAMCMEGYSYEDVVRFANKAIRMFNRCRGVFERIYLSSEVVAGRLILSISSVGGECSECEVYDDGSLMELVDGLYLLFMDDLLIVGNGDYLGGHLRHEFSVVTERKQPEPFVLGSLSNTLYRSLMNNADYCKKYGKGTTEPKKVVGGGNVIIFRP